MREFSASDAAFEGFRLTREQPRAVLVWAVVFWVLSLVSGGLLVTFAGEALTELTALGQGGATPDPSAFMAQMGSLAPVGLISLVLGLLFYGVLYSAVNRAVLRPREGGPGFLRFGGDELRQAGALALTFLLLFAAYIGLVLLALVVGGLAGAAGGVVGGVLGGLLAFLLVLGGLAFVLVRFSLVSPLTFGRGRIQVLESWRVTKGRFWPLLGAFVLALVLVIVVYLLGMMIFLALAALVGGGGMEAIGQAFSPDYSSVGAYFTPAILIYTVVTSVLGALSVAIMGGTAASAYRQITGEGADTAEVFS